MSGEWHRKINYFSPWLVNFLSSRELKKPDQRPLYKYHTSYVEYEELKQLIVNYASPQELTTNNEAAACFILFCSEWYRREYVVA